MTAWEAFAGVAAFVTLALLVLARASATVVDDDAVLPPGDDRTASSLALLANLTLSQGALAAVLVGGAWLTGVPPSAVGLGAETRGAAALLAGVGVGVALAAGNEALSLAADRLSGRSERLRDLLAPTTPSGWLVLLGVALPVVAGFEELLFRGVLVGAMAAGFGVSPWALAVASSALFGVAHGAQGVGGMLATGALGFALAAVFVLTGSLLAVVVAHYLVNALEFLVNA